MATSYYLIPTDNYPNYFVISLFGNDYTLTFTWNKQFQYWVLDIGDGVGNPILTGTALVTGANLTSKFAYLNLPPLFATSTFDSAAPPTETNLGLDGQLWTYFVSLTAINQ